MTDTTNDMKRRLRETIENTPGTKEWLDRQPPGSNPFINTLINASRDDDITGPPVYSLDTRASQRLMQTTQNYFMVPAGSLIGDDTDVEEVP